MSILDVAMKEFVQNIVVECLSKQSTKPAMPELISVEETTDICGVGRSVIDSLIQNSPANGFPVVRLSPKVIKVDKVRLFAWLNQGGLNCGID